jgi:hypothetical protein
MLSESSVTKISNNSPWYSWEKFSRFNLAAELELLWFLCGPQNKDHLELCGSAARFNP